MVSMLESELGLKALAISGFFGFSGSVKVILLENIENIKKNIAGNIL